MNSSPGAEFVIKFGYDAAVGAGDEQRFRLLTGGRELLEQLAMACEETSLKRMDSFDQLLHFTGRTYASCGQSARASR